MGAHRVLRVEELPHFPSPSPDGALYLRCWLLHSDYLSLGSTNTRPARNTRGTATSFFPTKKSLINLTIDSSRTYSGTHHFHFPACASLQYVWRQSNLSYNYYHYCSILLNTTEPHELSQSYSALFTTIRSYSSCTTPQSTCLLSDLRNSLLAPARLLAALCLQCPGKAKQMENSSGGRATNLSRQLDFWRSSASVSASYNNMTLGFDRFYGAATSRPWLIRQWARFAWV
ncbi:hypothetical protein HZ326_20386 [Fusarium oxysporum f. sp. albedinis]|nr:hypothetical protein HZ326_20386 [Fusarium oxysporum f. sp. albedinis]